MLHTTSQLIDGNAVITYANIHGRPQEDGWAGLVGWVMPVLMRCWKRCLDLVRGGVFPSHLAPGWGVWTIYDINNIDKKWVTTQIF